MKKSSTPTIQIKLTSDQAIELEAKAQFRGEVSKSEFYAQCLLSGARAAKAIKPVEQPRKKTRVEEVKEAVVTKAAKKVAAKKVAEAPADAKASEVKPAKKVAMKKA